MREEKDALGVRSLPDDTYYGIQTVRAMENFNVSNKTFAKLKSAVTLPSYIKRYDRH